ncbi:putative arabinogalactan peptide, AGP [Rosa chinensis]|uniref:Putative arabinogalactan peptide, AGP n=1 Tax=Rosa chinensis TaxID=74649 RepID=A0A2P6RJH3_ROSCH|nr:putative arabinogalactan peptide, AGP [Rosa chinensis]
MNSFRPCCALPIIGFMFMALLSLSYGQEAAPAPSPTSDGAAIDQGIAYILLVLALAMTYLLH